jgi:hypothetical protein
LGSAAVSRLPWAPAEAVKRLLDAGPAITATCYAEVGLGIVFLDAGPTITATCYVEVGLGIVFLDAGPTITATCYVEVGLGDTVVGDGDGEIVVGDGDGDGEIVVGDGLGDEVDGVGEGEGVCEWCGLGVEVCPWAGPTRFGVCTCLLGVSSSTSAPTTTAATATTPPVAAPAANARRSRWDSVRLRSRSHCGSEARCAAQLLNGAAA